MFVACFCSVLKLTFQTSCCLVTCLGEIQNSKTVVQSLLRNWVPRTWLTGRCRHEQLLVVLFGCYRIFVRLLCFIQISILLIKFVIGLIDLGRKLRFSKRSLHMLLNFRCKHRYQLDRKLFHLTKKTGSLFSVITLLYENFTHISVSKIDLYCELF